jgi:hypothetical protein
MVMKVSGGNCKPSVCNIRHKKCGEGILFRKKRRGAADTRGYRVDRRENSDVVLEFTPRYWTGKNVRFEAACA